MILFTVTLIEHDDVTTDLPILPPGRNV